MNSNYDDDHPPAPLRIYLENKVSNKKVSEGKWLAKVRRVSLRHLFRIIVMIVW